MTDPAVPVEARPASPGAPSAPEFPRPGAAGPGGRPWRQVDLRFARRIPSMMTDEERRYLYWLAREAWRARGHIVEIGPWLGGSTICLAEGMRHAIRGGRQAGNLRLHVFDNFIWREFMRARAPLPLRDGESFEAFFRGNLEAHLELLEIHRAWLPDEAVAGDAWALGARGEKDGGACELAWRSEDPVEILFVDGAKSWTAFHRLLEEFAPALEPGASRLVLQDFKHWGAYWVPAIAQALENRLEPEVVLPENTVAFKLRRPISREDIRRLPAFEAASPGAIEALLRGAAAGLVGLGDPLGAAIVRLGEVRMRLQKGDAAGAFEALARSDRSWPRGLDRSSLHDARRWLRRETGKPLRAPARSHLEDLRSAWSRAGRKACRALFRS